MASNAVLNELLRSGVITQGQFDWALENGGDDGKSAIRALVDSKSITRFQAAQAGGTLMGFNSVDLGDVVVNSAAADKLSAEQCRRWNVIGYAMDGGTLLVAAPLRSCRDVNLRDDITRIVNGPIRFVVADEQDITAKINATYRAEGALHALAQVMTDDKSSTDSDLDAMTEAVEDDPLVRFVNELIKQAIRDRASDIHLEPYERGLKIRFRIDGVLHTQRMPSPDKGRTINRLKVMSGMDIGNKYKPDDGRLTLPMPGSSDGVVDLRVNSLPTVWGEKIVMRILDNSNASASLADLGFSDHNLERFSKSFTKPHGLILVTGPTGSGKSTTLYATINKIASESINVVTVEDPVEYRIDGINQVAVNAKQGRSFATSLRAILRQDPDVILLGEIRDEETAEIAVTAALTGHLVLSTLHTNDAASAITRLTEMGVAPFLIGDAVDCVIAQRLLRRICLHCREPYQPTPEQFAAFGVLNPTQRFGADNTFYRAATKGCQRCSNTGYQGRIAVHEVMLITPVIARAATAKAQATQIAELAAEDGMVSLRDAAINHAANGLTSLEEILKIAV